MSRIKNARIVAGFLLGVTAAACASQAETPPDDGASTVAEAPGAATSGTDLMPDPGGRIITVRMMTDEQGNNRFEPAHLEAKRGDVIRYTLVSGVHNANFLPDSNAGTAGLPAAGPLLQLPEQTWDVKVTFGPGTHFFHCDPHALLGMVGHLTVKE